MAGKKLALLKWCGGLDDKTYTSGIPIEWIRNFDYDDYQSGESSAAEVYAVEWKDTRKPPNGGWKLYDAYVVHVSDRRQVLNEKLRVLEGLVSPYKTVTQNARKSSEGKNKENEVKQPNNPTVPNMDKQNKRASSSLTSLIAKVPKPKNSKERQRIRRISSSDPSDSDTQNKEVSGIDMLPESPKTKNKRTNFPTNSTGLEAVDMEEQQVIPASGTIFLNLLNVLYIDIKKKVQG